MPLERGDAFEVQNVVWIRSKLPYYEPLWETFIGHDGKGWPVEIPGLNEDQEKRRSRFYQAHYTFALAAWRMEKTADEIHQTAGFATNFTEFEAVQDQLFRFASRMGQIRDMFVIMQDSLRGENFSEALQQFYALRSNVLHGPRLPVRTDDGIVRIPKIGGISEIEGEWTSKALWTDVDPKTFIPVDDFVQQTENEFMRLVCDAHGKVFPAADRCFENKHVPAPSNDSGAYWDPQVGMAEPAISACLPPPSGNYSSTD